MHKTLLVHQHPATQQAAILRVELVSLDTRSAEKATIARRAWSRRYHNLRPQGPLRGLKGLLLLASYPMRLRRCFEMTSLLICKKEADLFQRWSQAELRRQVMGTWGIVFGPLLQFVPAQHVAS